MGTGSGRNSNGAVQVPSQLHAMLQLRHRVLGRREEQLCRVVLRKDRGEWGGDLQELREMPHGDHQAARRGGRGRAGQRLWNVQPGGSRQGQPLQVILIEPVNPENTIMYSKAYFLAKK